MPVKLRLNRRLLFLSSSEEGFSIIEILSAISLIAIVTLGTVPLFVSGLRGSLISKLDTAGKNLSQERFEAMRNLPLYIQSSQSSPPSSCWTDPTRSDPRNPSTGVIECDYKDMLDTYFRSAAFTATSTATGGYVPSNSGRSQDEIDASLSAPFYRYVISPVPNFQNGRFKQAVVSQFLDSNLAPVTPSTAYNTQVTNGDLPPSRLLGVTVITTWQAGNLSKRFISYTQIAEGPPESTVLTLLSQATALDIRTGLDALTQLQLVVGTSGSNGSLSNGANVATRTQGAFAAIAPVNTRIDGLTLSSSAPPTSNTTGGSSSPQSLSYAGYTAAFFADTGGSASAGIINEHPYVPNNSNAGTGSFFSSGTQLRSGAANDITLTNRTLGSASDMQLLSISDPNMVRSKEGGGGSAAAGETYLKAASGSGRFVESGGRASLQKVRLLPTTFAPEGVVQLELTSASIVCKTTTTSSSGTGASFSGKVRYWDALFNGGSYREVTLTRGGLNTLPNPADVFVSVIPPLTLSHYIKEWSALSTETTVISSPPRTVTSNLNGIISVTTQNTRSADPSSAIVVTVGLLSCTAEDLRP